jgi:hypothetical protein
MRALRCRRRHVAAAAGGFVQRPQRFRSAPAEEAVDVTDLRAASALPGVEGAAQDRTRTGATIGDKHRAAHVRVGARLTIRTSRKRAADDSADAGPRKRGCAPGSVAAQMSVHVADVPRQRMLVLLVRRWPLGAEQFATTWAPRMWAFVHDC